MPEFLLVLVGAVLVNNVVLVQFLGLNPLINVSNKQETAIGMAVATTFVLTLSSVFNYLLHTYVLVPLGVEYLRTLTFILVIATLVQLTDTAMRKSYPLLHRKLGIFVPLIAANCAVLGVALLTIKTGIDSFFDALLYGIGSALGFALALILFAGLRERIAVADVPVPFQGASIGMITAGLMSLAFMGFAGLVKL